MKLLLKNVTKAYGETFALQDFTVEMTPGIYALLGPNGAGKSTLMNILAGNLPADSGTVVLEDGEQIPHTDVRFRKNLGFMPQYPGLYPTFTPEEFLGYMASLKNIAPSAVVRQIDRLLETLELTDVRKKKIRTLSGGMKQRLTLAQAMLGEPKILLLDEPTAGLDPKQRIAVRNFLAEIAFDKIVLFATHVVPDIEFIAKEALILKKGVLQTAAPPSELTKTIDGRVWNLSCAEADVRLYQAKFAVTNITRDERTRGVNLRILSDERPGDAAEPVVPTLEDYYLYIFGEHSVSGS